MTTEKFACPCCGHKTFAEEPNGLYYICPVCYWEDDPIQLNDPDYDGGSNKVSLRLGQKNFLKFGACEKEMIKNVRPPNTDEQRNSDWNPIK